MKPISGSVLLAGLICTVLALGGALSPAWAEQALNHAVATFVQGPVTLQRPGVEARPLSVGTLLYKDDVLETGADGRVEISLADGSQVRFASRTKFLLETIWVDAQQGRDFKVRVILGRLWAKVASAAGISGGFEASSGNMTAGVRGTTYRMIVEDSGQVVVRVYWGEVIVKSASEMRQAPGAVRKPSSVSAPSSVPGPKPVPGPSSVSMMEWVQIVAAMQQVAVLPDGQVTQPTPFDPEEDRDEWVIWNQQRDGL